MDWVFDLRTAIVLGALVTWLTGGLLLLSWTSLPRAVRPSLRWWLAGLVLHPAGFLLVSLRPVLPASLGVVLANALLAVAFACMVIALRSFYGLPQRRARLYGLAAAMALVSLGFTWLLPNLQARQSVEALLLALLLAHSASAVFRSDGPPGLVARLTGGLFALAGLGEHQGGRRSRGLARLRRGGGGGSSGDLGRGCGGEIRRRGARAGETEGEKRAPARRKRSRAHEPRRGPETQRYWHGGPRIAGCGETAKSLARTRPNRLLGHAREASVTRASQCGPR